MIHLFKELDILKELLRRNQVILFLDYDGTLTPIVEKPEMAVLPSKAKKVLKELAKNKNFHVFIISGRSMIILKELVDIDNIVCIGNHGLEIEGENIDFEGFSFSRFREILDFLKWEITKELAFFQGAFVEDKGLGLSVHYRMLNLKDESIFKHLLEDITDKFCSMKEIRITSGKKVFELRPPIDWDKGKALLWILKNQHLQGSKRNVIPVYIGDDATDEDAFLAIEGMGITIHVGNEEYSCAQYYLNNTDEVVRFLEYLHKAKHDEKISKP